MLYKNITFLFFFIMFCKIATTSTFAQSTDWGTPYDKFFEMDNLEPKYSRLKNGEEKRSVEIPRKTRIHQTRRDGKTSTMAIDSSGHGAILCTREIYIAVKIALDNCRDLNYSTASMELDLALQKIDKFILENSIEQVSQLDLEADYKRKNAGFRSQISDSSSGMCKIQLGEGLAFMERIADQIEKMPQGDFKKQLAQILSVPRLPVMNPCL